MELSKNTSIPEREKGNHSILCDTCGDVHLIHNFSFSTKLSSFSPAHLFLVSLVTSYSEHKKFKRTLDHFVRLKFLFLLTPILHLKKYQNSHYVSLISNIFLIL